MRKSKDINPTAIAQKIDASKKLNSDGSLSFTAFESTCHADILAYLLTPDVDIPTYEKARMSRLAIFEAGKKGAVTKKSVDREIHRSIEEFCNKKYEKYILVTEISLANSMKRRTVMHNGCRIVINAKISKRISKARAKVFKHAVRSYSCPVPNDYAYVMVYASGRSFSEGAEKALEALGQVRGVLNYINNYTIGFRWSSGRREPVNRIILGPIHTIHHANGDIASDSWWFDESYDGQIRPLSDSNRFDELMHVFRVKRKSIKRVRYSSELFSVFDRFSSALDSRNFNISLLGLWGVIEKLTDSKNSNYDVAIRRCIFLFKDIECARVELEAIRKYRNIYVHDGNESYHLSETLVYRLKMYAEALINFHVGNADFFPSISDAASLLDAPTTVAGIDAKMAVLRKAKEFNTVR